VNYLSLFSGIGGLDLGLDRAGMTCVGQVELDPFCRTVLTEHWPEVPKHDDVRTAPGWWLGTTRPRVDLVAGGFPCQPFSTAGRRQGIADERWGWPWFADIVRVARPRYILVENVAALLRDADAFGIILADLAAFGYDADWDCIPAAAVGAPHLRDRLFLVAHTQRDGLRDEPVAESWSGGTAVTPDDGAHRAVAHAEGDHGEQPVYLPAPVPAGRAGVGAAGGDARRDWWLSEPRVGRVAHGVSKQMVAPHLHALGNAVVPQVAEHIGRLILDHAAAVAL
jgi:DNA (cytosine-5)-methyltransferase 1